MDKYWSTSPVYYQVGPTPTFFCNRVKDIHALWWGFITEKEKRLRLFYDLSAHTQNNLPSTIRAFSWIYQSGTVTHGVHFTYPFKIDSIKIIKPRLMCSVPRKIGWSYTREKLTTGSVKPWQLSPRTYLQGFSELRELPRQEDQRCLLHRLGFCAVYRGFFWYRRMRSG